MKDETETSFGLLANATEMFRYALTSILVLLFKYTSTLTLHHILNDDDPSGFHTVSDDVCSVRTSASN